MKANNYSVTINNASKELSAKERVAIKDTSNCVKLDLACDNGEKLTINVDYVVVLDVHNDKAEDKDYQQYVVADLDGTKYATCSTSFFDALENIMAEMNGIDEDWAVEVYKLPSKNYKGKSFLTCSII